MINHGRIAAIDTPENLRAQSAELQYVEAAFDKVADLRELSENPNVVKVLSVGNKVRVYTADPHTVVEFLVDFAKRNGLRILTLNTMMPSLEDVFLKLVKGREAVIR